MYQVFFHWLASCYFSYARLQRSLMKRTALCNKYGLLAGSFILINMNEYIHIHSHFLKYKSRQTSFCISLLVEHSLV